jgi:hypothetical protein
MAAAHHHASAVRGRRELRALPIPCPAHAADGRLAQGRRPLPTLSARQPRVVAYRPWTDRRGHRFRRRRCLRIAVGAIGAVMRVHLIPDVSVNAELLMATRK